MSEDCNYSKKASEGEASNQGHKPMAVKNFWGLDICLKKCKDNKQLGNLKKINSNLQKRIKPSYGEG